MQLRQVDDYLMQLRISTNPHLEPKVARQLIESLLQARGGAGGSPDREFDRSKFEELRKALKNRPGGPSA